MKKTLIALMALAGISFGAGTGEFVVPTAQEGLKTNQDYAPGNYTFSFTIDEADVTYTEGVITALNGGSVLALMGNYSANNYESNGYVLGVDNGAITLSVGRGAMGGLSTGDSAISPTTTFTISTDGVSGGMLMADNAPVTLTLGTEYTIVNEYTVDGRTINQNVSIYVAGSSEVLASVTYKGNMNGGTSGSTISVWGNAAYNVVAQPTSIVPEPATATLSLLALAGLAARRRRK